MSADFTINIIANQNGTPISAGSGGASGGGTGGKAGMKNPNGGPHDDEKPVVAAFQNFMELGKALGSIFHGAQHMNFKLMTTGILRLFREMHEFTSSLGRMVKDVPGSVTDINKFVSDWLKKLFPSTNPTGTKKGPITPANAQPPTPGNTHPGSNPPGQNPPTPPTPPGPNPPTPPAPNPPGGGPVPLGGGPVPPVVPPVGAFAGLFSPIGIAVAAVVAALVAMVAATVAATYAMINMQKRAEKEAKEYAVFSPKLGEIANRLEMAERMRKAYTAEKLSGPISDVLESKIQFDNAVNKVTTATEAATYRLLSSLTPMMERLAMFLENVSRIMDIIEFLIIRPKVNAIDNSRKIFRGAAVGLDHVLTGFGGPGWMQPFRRASDVLVGPGSDNRVSDPFFDDLMKSSTRPSW